MTFRHEVRANVSARAEQPKRPKPVATVVNWDSAIARLREMLDDFYPGS